MPTWTNRLRRWRLGGTLASLVLAQAGCGSKPAPAPTIEPGPVVVTEEALKKDSVPDAMSLTGVAVGANGERYDQAFDEVATTEVLEGQQQPPDRTIAGKGTAKLRAEVEKLWASIPLARKGLTIPYVLQIETDEGPIEIALQSHLAPNHVRNIIALTKVGYYDGLRFETLLHETSRDETEHLDLVIAGCPLGTGEDGFGHLGYFLKSEHNTHIKHEAGSVGFWRDPDQKDSAGCRFYITLGPTTTLDKQEYTLFGKVTKGLEAVRRIAAQPVKGKAEPENQQPVAPTVIRKMTVQPDPLEKSPPLALNE